jgi:hypothetical protein
MYLHSVRPLDTARQNQFTGNQQKKNQLMKAFSQRPLTKPEACMVEGGSRLPDVAAIMLSLLLLIGCFTPAPRLPGVPLFSLTNIRGH